MGDVCFESSSMNGIPFHETLLFIHQEVLHLDSPYLGQTDQGPMLHTLLGQLPC